MSANLRRRTVNRFLEHRVCIEPKYVIEDQVIRNNFADLQDFVAGKLADARSSNHMAVVTLLEAIFDVVEDTKKRTLHHSMVVTLN